ncbi:hypothetical protein J1N35_001399, partial [Gossypium stocksii]
FNLVYYSNVDWASTMEDRQLTFSYCVYLRPSPIAWCSKKAPNPTSRSSSKAEYRRLAHCISKILCIKQLLVEICVS